MNGNRCSIHGYSRDSCTSALQSCMGSYRTRGTLLHHQYQICQLLVFRSMAVSIHGSKCTPASKTWPNDESHTLATFCQNSGGGDGPVGKSSSTSFWCTTGKGYFSPIFSSLLWYVPRPSRTHADCLIICNSMCVTKIIVVEDKPHQLIPYSFVWSASEPSEMRCPTVRGGCCGGRAKPRHLCA